MHLGWAAKRLGYRAITPVFDGAKEEEIEAELARAWLVDRAWSETAATAWEWMKGQDYTPENIRDDDEVRSLYLEQWLGSRGYDVYQIASDLEYVRRSTAFEWLKDKGYDPNTILAFEIPVNAARAGMDDNAQKACLRLARIFSRAPLHTNMPTPRLL